MIVSEGRRQHWLGVVKGAQIVALIGTLMHTSQIFERNDPLLISLSLVVLTYVADFVYYLVLGVGILAFFAGYLIRKGERRFAAYLAVGACAGICWSLVLGVILLVVSPEPGETHFPLLGMNVFAGICQMAVIWHRRVGRNAAAQHFHGGSDE